MKGIDYAFSPHPAPSAVRSAGYGFVARYLSPIAANDHNGKNLLPAELTALLAAGLAVVLVEESAANRMLGGHPAGVADGQHAQAVTKALGMTAVPVYFACDFDATEAEQVLIDAYLDGAASVIGRDRTGIYGGFWPVSRALTAGKATWAWQTVAWSGGQWDPRAHIRQHGAVTVGGISGIDTDESMHPDFGQWPRPSAPAPAPPPAPQYPVPVLLSQTVQPVTVHLGWEAGTPVSPHWRVQVAHWDGKPGAPVEIPDGGMVTIPDASVTLPGPGPYAWRVQAAGGSPFTPWRPFTA